MEGLARAELTRKDAALKEKEDELLAQREQIRDLHAHLRDERVAPSESAHASRVAEEASGQLTELPAVHPPTSTFDDVVLHMVRTLNLEISEVASQVTNAFRVAETPDPDRVTPAFDRAREAVGPVMAELLETIQHQEDPILIDIALKADMVGFAAEIASAWDFQHQSKSVFTGVYKQMRRSESQLACAQWRSHARKYSKQRLYNGRDLATGFAHQLAERIADLLTVAGSSTSSDDICATYTSHLETIVRTALELQRTIGEEVTSCDYEVLVVRIDEVYDTAQMEDIYNGEIVAAGPPGIVPRVLSTVDLGLRRSEKVDAATETEGAEDGAGAGAEDGVVTTMLLKPKVVLDTIVYELGLVDEEDPSPSTAEPSA
ncbi:hypothetical protein L226DRAFT_470729 [Lentinus tigrinus ALCF2SS1-7]|uniref:Uncharacterized protein n=1 Tax=Lentinus tigrinus ALCF2SS1-6 TaxID=1328759 RepID=A0A5C2RWT9_9APHY|nr:hypothetical protein L227DRAFT_510390 [Lentinus tigrinus ALCF2SS1-6]RPD70090.1 hypothetical protein L226DRAFT_470729 [Lentinus tigrinus ALCF2SS1-7]